MKKRKATGRELPEMLGKAVPESELYKNLQMLERRADAMLARKRVDVQAALGKTLHMRRTLRVWVYTTSGGQPRQTPEAREEPRIALEAAAETPVERLYRQEGGVGGDSSAGCKGGAAMEPASARGPAGQGEGEGGGLPMASSTPGADAAAEAARAEATRAPGGPVQPEVNAPGVKDADMWTLNVYGQLLPVDQPGGRHPDNSGSSAAVEATELMLSSLLSRLEVRFEGDGSPVAGRSVAWDGTAYGGEPRKCFTTHSPGKPQGTATVLLWPNWQPAKYKVPEALARVIGTDLETKPRVVAKLWKYIQMLDLQSTSDPTKFICDAKLEEVFSEPLVDFGSIDAHMKKLLQEPEPIEVRHSLDPDGPSPSQPECLDIEIDVPIPSSEPESLMKLLDVSKKMKALDQKLAASMKDLEEHKKRRFFYLAFSHSPVDFIRSLLESQQRDLDLLQGVGGDGDTTLAATEHDAQFGSTWVEDAACKYLQRRSSRVGGAL